ncbi:ABC transporter ATP-binding protein [Methanomethylovorans sp.]|uniref:ABC transporter ATP-binding protein n=1 Tax=Methanomethylovorans sp. TaxID=2758717 RepID=UPI00345E5DEC
MGSIISVRGVTKRFAGHAALDNIDLNIEKGEFVLLLGPNGAGKTTLLKILETLMRPSSGSVEIGGLELSKAAVKIRKTIGVISHESYLYNDLTVEENLRFFGKMHGLSGNELTTRVEMLLEQMHLEHRYMDRVSTLSRGMQQRLSIARSLIHGPEIILMDEPYTGLDLQSACDLEKMLLENRGKATVLMATHEIYRTFNMCDRIIILCSGKIIFDILQQDIGSVDKLKDLYTKIYEGMHDT